MKYSNALSVAIAVGINLIQVPAKAVEDTLTDPTTAMISKVQFENENLLSILGRISNNARLDFNVEDISAHDSRAFSNRVIRFSHADATLREVLDDLATTTAAFRWQYEDGAVNIVNLAGSESNPFDQKVESFSFKGPRADFLKLMQKKVKSFKVFELSGKNGPVVDAVVSFQTNKTETLRDVFNSFADSDGVFWHALIPAKRETGFSPSTEQDLGGSAYTIVGFFKK
jgi:hypothetical protein